MTDEKVVVLLEQILGELQKITTSTEQAMKTANRQSVDANAMLNNVMSLMPESVRQHMQGRGD